MAQDGALVNDGALERGHEGSTHNGHHQEGGSQGGIGEGDLFQCRAVDGGEHKAHEETDAHKTVKSGLAHDEDGSQAEDERVGRCLQECQSKGEDVEAEAEEREALAGGCRDEQEGANGIERQAQQDASFVAVTADEQGRRDGHGGVTAIEGKLDEGSLGCRQFHQCLECRHHGVGDIVRESPQCKQHRDDHEG